MTRRSLRHLHVARRALARGKTGQARRLLMQGIVIAREGGSDALPLRITLARLLRCESWHDALRSIQNVPVHHAPTERVHFTGSTDSL